MFQQHFQVVAEQRYYRKFKMKNGKTTDSDGTLSSSMISAPLETNK